MFINVYLGAEQLRTISRGLRFLRDIASLDVDKDGYYHIKLSDQAYKAMLEDREINPDGNVPEVPTIYGLKFSK